MILNRFKYTKYTLCEWMVKQIISNRRHWMHALFPEVTYLTD